MFKFFRKIRQNLLNEGKTTRYFKYAIGEVVLVVIGILIALQINNWNENRKEKHQEQVILQQLQTEFKSNLKQLDEKISIRQEIMNSAIQVLGFIDNHDSRVKQNIDKHVMTTIGFTTFDPVDSNFTSTDGLRLISNNKLKQMLSFWTSEIIQVIESEQVWLKYRNEIYIPFIIKNYQLRTARNQLIKSNYLKKFQINIEMKDFLTQSGGIGVTSHTEDFNQLLDNPDYEDHLVRCIITNNIADVQSSILRKRIVEILNVIKNEIKEQ